MSGISGFVLIIWRQTLDDDIKDDVLGFHSFIPSRNGGGRWQGGDEGRGGMDGGGQGRDVPRSSAPLTPVQGGEGGVGIWKASP